MIVFEDWIEKPFSRANRKQESAINLAELYWQGLDPDLTVSIPIQNFAKIPLAFPDSSILIKHMQDLLVEIKYAWMNLCALKVIIDSSNEFISG